MSLSNLRPGQPVIIDEDRHCTFLFAENNDEIDLATNRAFPDLGDTYISFWYAIRNKELVIKEASYFCRNEEAANYLKSKGISGDQDNVIGSVHCNMNTKIDYSGKMIIADRRVRDYCISGNTFLEYEDWTDFDHPWWAYEEVKEYIIEKGDVVDVINHSDFVSSFRRNITHSDLFEVRMMIDPRFSHQIKENNYDKEYWWLNKAISLKNTKIHDLYLPYQDKYYGFFYRVYISKEKDDILTNLLNEINYIITIDDSNLVFDEKEILDKLNSSEKQGIMYTLLKYNRGKLRTQDIVEAYTLIDELY